MLGGAHCPANRSIRQYASEPRDPRRASKVLASFGAELQLTK